MKVPHRFLAALAALAAAAAFAQDFSKVEIKATRITDTLYMLTGGAATSASPRAKTRCS